MVIKWVARGWGSRRNRGKKHWRAKSSALTPRKTNCHFPVVTGDRVMRGISDRDHEKSKPEILGVAAVVL